MKGKIVSYDPINGKGKIITKEKGIKPFYIENWIDYEKYPEIGLEVEFDILNNEIRDIVSIKTIELLDELEEKFYYVLPQNLKIKENKSLTTCLEEEFFDKFKKIALKYKKLLSFQKNLPYKKIKRFLMTAYNNLLEIDISINDQRLKDIKNSLDEVECFYDNLQNETKNPVYILLEKLVLKKQQDYQVFKKRYENNKTFIMEATKQANILELKIEKLKNNISKLKHNSKKYKESIELLKSYKRKYVDLIDEAQNLKEENSKISEDIHIFENTYKEIFEKIFNKEVSILLKILEKEMNVLAYQFDTILWENAKDSKIIEKFFEESKIEGNYSTKTFIKYYLKTLKTDKMNKKDSELAEIFKELKVFSKKIIIYESVSNRCRELRTYIENLDHDNDVKCFNLLKDFIIYIKENDLLIDIAIIDINESNKHHINKILNILYRLGVKVVLFSETLKDESIVQIDELYKRLKLIV